MNLERRLNRAVKLGELIARVARKRGQIKKAVETEMYVDQLKKIISDIYGPVAGDIGKPIRHEDLPGEEPLTVPEFDPTEVPEETPVEDPEKVPA